MDWVFLSPHPDDAAFSAGGLIWELAQAGQRVEIWTVCSGDPLFPLSEFAKSLHARWQTGPAAPAQRRLEDEQSAGILGAALRRFDLPDCIYRRSPQDGRALYASEEAIFGPLHEEELPLVSSLAELFSQTLSPTAQLVAPYTLGGHVDHRLVRRAAEALRPASPAAPPLFYYLDLPYVLYKEAWQASPGVETPLYPISAAGIAAWQASIAAHASQISSFWPSTEAMQLAVQGYHNRYGGLRLLHFG